MSTRDRPLSASLDIILFLKDVALFESVATALSHSGALAAWS